MKLKTKLIALLAPLLFMGNTMAGEYINSTPAVPGYDVVSYHTGNRPEQNVPAFGDYCAFGASVDTKFVGDPEVWQVIDGGLYLNLDPGIQSRWLQDLPTSIKTADAWWRELEHKNSVWL